MNSRFNILVRIKPPEDIEKTCVFTSNSDERSLYVINEKRDIFDNKKIIKSQRHFSLDKIYDVNTTNEDIYIDVFDPIINNFNNRNNITIFLYGQTGSGKTFTSIGKNRYYPGIIYYILKYFDNHDKSTYLTAVQIYNNNCFDLFDNHKPINQYEDNNGKIIFKNCKKKYLDEHKPNDLIEQIHEKRFVGISSENNNSSRSHLLIQLWCNDNYISLIDLAGSEKAKKSICANKQEMRENAKINESILVLKECIRASKNKQSYIPYRQNNLTKILKDTFTGNCISFIIGTISPEMRNISETMNTLSYITDMKSLKRQISHVKIQRDISKEDFKLNENYLLHYLKKFEINYEGKKKLIDDLINNRSNNKEELRENIKKELIDLQDFLKLL